MSWEEEETYREGQRQRNRDREKEINTKGSNRFYEDAMQNHPTILKVGNPI